jgi:hypothetical protein
MRRWFAPALTFLAIGLASLCFPTSQSLEPANPALAQAELYRWFDSLGYDAVLNGKFGRIQEVSGSFKGGKVFTQNTFGFLVNGQPLTLTNLDLATNVYQSDQVIRDWKTHVSFEELDLGDWLKTQLELIERSTSPFSSTSIGDGGKTYGDVELFVLSRAASARKLDAIANLLYLKLSRENNFVDSLKQDVEFSGISSLAVEIGIPYIPRTETVEGLKRFCRNFPSDTYVSFAKDAISVLSQMDSKSNPLQNEQVERLPIDRRIPALINELADQTGYQRSIPGECDVFSDPRGEKSPAAQLAKIGYPALPQLLNTLSDRRFSYSERALMTPPFTVLRVREVALQIIEKIANRPFHLSDAEGQSVSLGGAWSLAADEAKAAILAKAVRTWWATTRSLGERQSLIEGVRAGSYSSADQALRLIAAYPKDALPSISEGVKLAKDGWVRVSLLEALKKLPGTEKLSLARREMKLDRDLSVRLAGAEVVAEANPEIATRAMISELARIRFKVVLEDQICQAKLIPILFMSGDPTAVNAIAKRLPDMEPRQRLDVVDDAMSYADSKSWFWSPFTRRAPLSGYKPAVANLLATELGDTTRLNLDGLFNGVNVTNPRVCEMAALALSELMPSARGYIQTAASEGLSRKQVADLNEWLKSKHRPMLPEPSKLPDAIGR